MGDNSENQCAISGRRAYMPEKILKNFKAEQILSGEAHNIAVSEVEESKKSKKIEEVEIKDIKDQMEDNILRIENEKDYGQLYSWGGSNINSTKGNQNQSALRRMDDFKRRKVSIINLSYSNTIVVTGQL